VGPSPALKGHFSAETPAQNSAAGYAVAQAGDCLGNCLENRHSPGVGLGFRGPVAMVAMATMFSVTLKRHVHPLVSYSYCQRKIISSSSRR
jgi:hypothetical protein